MESKKQYNIQPLMQNTFLYIPFVVVSVDVLVVVVTDEASTWNLKMETFIWCVGDIVKINGKMSFNSSSLRFTCFKINFKSPVCYQMISDENKYNIGAFWYNFAR